MFFSITSINMARASARRKHLANYFEVIIHRYNEVSLRENMNTRIAAGSRKGSKVLIHNGYKYQKNKVSNNIICWRCWRKYCRSFLKTRDFAMDNPNTNIVVVPASINDVDVRDSWAETWTGEPFILGQDNNMGCVIFCTNEDLLSLLNCEIVFIDGTFRSKSSPYMECTLITAYILRLV